MRRFPVAVLMVTLALPLLPSLLEAKTVHRWVPAGVAGTAPEEPLAPVLPRHSQDARRFLLPYFELVPATPSGLTTLWAVRNNGSFDLILDVEYRDPWGLLMTGESLALPADSTQTRNIRDVEGLTPAADGVIRGFAILRERIGVVDLFGDFFHVDPSGNAGRGGLLVNLDTGFCNLWTVRFLNGGPFSGGTELTVFVNNPLGADDDVDPPTFETRVFDERGNFYGVILTYTDRLSQKIHVSDLLRPLPALPFFGALEILIYEDADQGVILADYTAEERYSITVHGACR